MRLIDADALKDYIDCGHLRPPTELCFSELDVCNMIDERPTIEAVDMAIEALSADAVDVVRCRDCKWSYRYETSSGEYRCYCMEHGSSGHTDDDYCSCGEKVKL